MQIKEAKVFNFGKLQNKTYQFAPGINVIYGANEAGKSTLHAFLTGMLFGMEKNRGRATATDLYSRYEPWHAPSYYSGAVRFEVAGQPFYLERNFYAKEKSELLRNEADGEELSVAYGDLDVLLGGIDKEAFGNTYNISQSGAATGLAMTELLSEYLSDAANGGEGSVHVGQAISALQNRKKELTAKLRTTASEKEGEKRRLMLEAQLLEADCEKLQESQTHFEEEQQSLLQRQSEWNDLNTKIKSENLQKSEETDRETKSEKTSAWGLLLCGVCFVMWAAVCRLLVFSGEIFRIGVLVLVIIAGGFSIKNHRRRKEDNYQKYAIEKEPERVPENKDLEREAISHANEMLAQMKDNLQEKETRLFNLREQIELLENQNPVEAELEEDIAALDLAMTELERLTREYYEDMEDELNAEISRWVSLLTATHYDSVRLDKNGKLLVLAEGREVLPEALSRGTLEQIYMALRLAVGSIVTKEESIAIFLDEAFAMYDDERLAQTLKALAQTKKQIFIFTCQRREGQVLERMGITYQKIEML